MPGMIDISDRPTRRLYFLFLLGFATFGAVFTIIGAALPHIIRTFGWSYALTGTVLAANAVGYFVSTFVCGILVQRIAPRRVLIVGLALGAVSLSLFIRWPSPWLNLFLNLCVGLCQGTIEVVTNLEVMHMERKGQSRLLNLVHAAFCVGGIVGPAALGLLLGAGGGGLGVFAATAIVLALMGILFGVSPFPRIRQNEEQGTRTGLRLMLQPLLLLITVFLLLYVGAELGVSTWISEYFVRALGASPATGAFAVSLFWIGLLVGRFSLSVLYRGSRQEYPVLGLTILCAAALGLVLLVTSPWAVAIAVFLTGLGMSGIYPLSIAIVGRFNKSGMAVGAVTTGGGVGSFTFPFLMALLAQTVGIRGGFWFYLALAVVLVGLAAAIIRMTSRQSAPERNSRRTA
ncbi:MAG TPA: MFS transporter [Spirochaetia bacterium]|nr:MFS transporter [Spirochaetia bacterium]